MQELQPFRALFLLAILFTFTDCARVGRPSGGPEDTQPPVITETEPEMGALNFTGRDVEIHFDEYIVLENLQEKLVLSPPMREKPEVTLKGKWIDVDLKGQLRENITYTLVFGDAIVDNNEGNPIGYFEFVFSTGHERHRGIIDGHVYRAEDLEPEEGLFVMAYDNLADSAFRKTRPLYLSKADADGYWRIANMKKGKYRLYALRDANNNLRFDLPNESLAFLSEVVEPVIPETTEYTDSLAASPADTITGSPADSLQEQHSLAHKHLYLFQEKEPEQYITASERPRAWHLLMAFNLPVATDSVDFRINGSATPEHMTEYSQGKDTLHIWLKDTAIYRKELLECLLRYPKTDSLGERVVFTDSLSLRFTQAEGGKKGQTAQDTLLALNWNVTNGKTFPFYQKISCIAGAPVQQHDPGKLQLYRIKDSVETAVAARMIPDSTIPRLYRSGISPEEKTSYRLTVLPGYMTDHWGRTNDSLDITFTATGAKEYSTLILQVTGLEYPTSMLLINNNEEVLRSKRVKENGRVEFPWLTPGTYRLKALIDVNGDGRWTTGDFDLKRQPEPVTYFPGTIEIKENWDREEEWDLRQLWIKPANKNGK